MIEYWIDNKKHTTTSLFHIPLKKLHRDNEPAYRYFDNNILIAEWYYKNGLVHRDDGPSGIMYYKDGSLKSIHYYLYDEFYEDDKWKFIVDNKMCDIHPNNWSDDFKTMYELKYD